MKPVRIIFALIALGVMAAAAWSGGGPKVASADSEHPLMTVGAPIPVPRAIGRFDYLTVDEKYRRLLAVHTSSDELLVVNLDSGEVERRLKVGAGHGIAIDVYDGKIFVGTEDGYIAVLNRRWLVQDDQIKTNGIVDAMTFDPKNGRLYADHYDDTDVWVIQGRTNKMLQFPVKIAKGPEYVEYDPVSNKIYQNITSTNAVDVIDPDTNTVTAAWPIAPAADPRGLAIDGKGKRVFSAGGNGKLAVIDMTTGLLIQTISIPARVDQIAYDAVANKLYCASGTGLLTIIGDTPGGFERIGDVVIPRGAHTLAIDPKTHNVWIAYGGDQNDYVMKISPPPPASPTPPVPTPTPAATLAPTPAPTATH